MLTDKEKTVIYARALLTLARRMERVTEDLSMEQVVAIADGSRAEIGNMLIEHLQPDQITEIAAGSLCQSAASMFKDVAELLSALRGRPLEPEEFREAINGGVKKFIKLRLGEDVEI